MKTRLTRPLVAAFLVMAALALGSVVPAARSSDLMGASLTYTVSDGAAANTTRVAGSNEMSYPRLAVDRDPTSPFAGTMYVAGLDNITCASLVVRRSSDGGRTFRDPLRSDLCLQGPTLDLAVGRNGTLFAAARGPIILRSIDGGASWTVVASLNGTDPAATASIAVDASTGDVYAAWTPGDDPWSGAPGPIFISASRDGGDGWTAPILAVPANPGGNHPQVAVLGASVVIGLRKTGVSGPLVAAVVSQDRGETWGNVTAVSEPKGCPGPPGWGAGPSVAVSPDGIFAVEWAEWVNCDSTWDDAATWVAVSRDGGGSFGPPVLAGGPPGWAGGSSLGDQIVFDGASRLYATWHSVSENWTSASVYAASSSDVGGTFTNGSFTTRLHVSGGNSTAQENLAVGPGGVVFLVWVRFDETVNFTDPSLGIFLRPVVGDTDGEVLMNGAPAPAGIELEVRDNASGAFLARVPWSGTTVYLSGLPPGVVDVRIYDGNASAFAGRMPVRPWARTSFIVALGGGGSPTPVLWIATAGVGLGAALLAVIAVVAIRRRRRHPPP